MENKTLIIDPTDLAIEMSALSAEQQKRVLIAGRMTADIVALLAEWADGGTAELKGAVVLAKAMAKTLGMEESEFVLVDAVVAELERLEAQ